MRLSPFILLKWALPKAPPPARVAFLKAQPFAHRGLHDEQVPENSRAAFAAAVAAGHGIELDVQIAANGEPFVFHDEQLDRLTAEQGPLAARTGLELAVIKLFGSDEGIPRLSEVLDLVAGRVPILIEIKSNAASVSLICLAVRRALEGYQGIVAVMSFDPRVPQWFAEHAVRIPRGLVMHEAKANKLVGRLRALLSSILAVRHAHAQFIAFDVDSLPSHFATTMRAHGLPLLVWTVRSAAQEQLAFAHADEIIYEKPRR